MMIRYFILFLLATSFISCQETVSKATYDELKREHIETKKALGSQNEVVFKARQEINQVLYRISQVSNGTLGLRKDMENGNAKIRQAEQINQHINQLKSYINQLEKRTSDKEYIGIIRNLRTIISGQEKEIQQLKKTISEQEQQIYDQSVVITSQKRQINQAISDQAVLLFQAGQDLEKLADDIPDVSKKKNKKKLSQYQKTILRKALFYYEKAYQYGYASADRHVQKIKIRLYE